MAEPSEQQAAFILHRRVYRDTSFLLDVFSLHQGRISLVARGANSAKSPLKAQLQPFVPLLLNWQGRGDLKTVTAVEVQPHQPLSGAHLHCGFYVNELMIRLVPEQDPMLALFAAYLATMQSLAEAAPAEDTLRQFEQALLAALGYGFDWDWVSDAQDRVRADLLYAFDPAQGIVSAEAAHATLLQLPGAALLPLAAGDYTQLDAASRRIAKQVMRHAIDYRLQGRPLNSRRLFRAMHPAG